MTTRAWDKDWPQRVDGLAKFLGYEDIFDFVSKNEGKCFGELFHVIRNSCGGGRNQVAFVQFIEQYFSGASRRGLLREAITESLVRSLQHHLREGWNRGKRIRERRGEAHSDWHIPSTCAKKWLSIQEQSWKKLEALPPADDWCPRDRHDPLINAILDEVWPEERAGGH